MKPKNVGLLLLAVILAEAARAAFQLNLNVGGTK